MQQHFFWTVCSLVLVSSSQASFMPEEGSTCFVSSSHHSVMGPTGTYIYPVVGPTGSVEYYYDPMTEDIKTNPGIKYYNPDEKVLVLTEGDAQEDDNDYYSYNRLIVNDATLFDKIKTSRLYTIREIDFTPNNPQNDQLMNQTLVNFLENQTLISLSKVTLGNFQVSSRVLEALKNLQFGDEAVIRDSQFLDMQCGSATAPIRVSIDKKYLEDMKKEGLPVVKEALKPCSDYLPTIYMDNPSEERLARLKVYLN